MFLRLTKTVDALGNTTEYGYRIPDGTATGTPGALYDPAEIRYPTFTRQNRLDERERLTRETLIDPDDPTGAVRSSGTTYDKRGQMASETDANDNTRTYRYDALGRLIEYTDSLGHKTQAQYDARSNLLELADAKGQVHRFEYDRTDRLVKEILPLGQTTQYGYDAAGNLTERIEPNGHKTTYTHDAANRLVEARQYREGTELVRTTTYTFDAEDNLTAWSDTDHARNQSSGATLTYDDAGRKLGETVTYPDGYTLSYGYAYSAAGYKTRLIWPDGTMIEYGYSAHGQLDSVAIPGEGTISVNQFRWLAPAKLTLPGGTAQNKSYDGLLNLESLKIRNPGQETVLEVANTWGPMQELTASQRTDQAGIQFNSRYAYDDELRLTQVDIDRAGGLSPDRELFTLDAVGNRTAHSRTVGVWTYDANNRLTQQGAGINAVSYDYDEAGNLTRKTEPGVRVMQYAYDTQNRLSEVKDGSGNLIARYGYDPLDRRLWKEQYRDRYGNPLAQAQRTYYFYADEGLIAEATQPITLHADQSVTADSPPEITTQYGPRPDSPSTTGHLFVKTKNSSAQDTVAYYHHDHLGTPIQATDKAGAIVWSARYDAFGQATITTPTATLDNPTIISNLRLPGQIEDEETGLYYNWHRYYDPDIGRYISRDPIGLRGGVNTYAYVANNPLTWTDPTGLLFGGAFDAGESYGDSAAQYWADLAEQTGNPLYHIPGALAALWTPCTSDETVATLASGAGIGRYLGRPFWQYFPADNPAYSSRWFTRGWSWKPPYAPGADAARKLSLPPWNPATGVRPVSPPWWQPVRGPRPVRPDFGQPGGGIEYYRGWNWP